MIHFVGAGSGDPELITVKGKGLVEQADVLIWAGSLVNPAILNYCKDSCEIHDSKELTLEQVVLLVENAEMRGLRTVRLHTGDPSIYGAIREQMDAFAKRGFEYEVVPGVSSFNAAAASLKAELTLPGVSQTVILTRMEGRTPMPAGESIAELASHKATMAIFLSASLLNNLQQELLKGGYSPSTPCAIVYKASWPEEEIYRCRLDELAQTGTDNHIKLTALVIVGDVLGDSYDRSLLYHPHFETLFREVEAAPQAVIDS